MLDITELEELELNLRSELETKLTGIVSSLNRSGRLEEFLEMIGLRELLSPSKQFMAYKTGKIVVLGESEVKQDILEIVGKKLGIDKRRFDFYLGYEEAAKFDSRIIQWNPNYSLILVGPLPHSGVSKGDYSSIIAAMENEDGYPPLVRLGANSLKITKSSFQAALIEAIENGTIDVI